jgi:hypothetical protein
MACDRTSNTISGLAATRTGLSKLSSKAGNVAGTVIGKWARSQDFVNETILRQAAPVSNKVLRAVDRPAVAAAKVAPILAGVIASTRLRGYLVKGEGQPPVVAVAATFRSPAEMARNRQALSGIRKGIGALGVVSGVSASLAAQATRNESEGRTLALKKGGKAVATVKFQKSERMTRFLNKADLIGSHILGQNVVTSEGDIVQAGRGGTPWHRGTSVVKTSQGERTLTHLQSLKLPGQHFYFDRRLSDEEVAGVVTGREKAPQMPGYVGEIHALESLAPLWGATKKAMITNRLYWPTPKAEWSRMTERAQTTVQPQTVTMSRVKPKQTLAQVKR